AGPRLELRLDDRLQLLHELRQHVQTDDRGLVQILDLQGVAVADLDELADAEFLDGLVRFLDADGVQIDADALGAELLGGGGHDAAVAAAEVKDEVVLGDLGHVEHLLDRVLRRGGVDLVVTFLVLLALAVALPAAEADEAADPDEATT